MPKKQLNIHCQSNGRRSIRGRQLCHHSGLTLALHFDIVGCREQGDDLTKWCEDEWSDGEEIRGGSPPAAVSSPQTAAVPEAAAPRTEAQSLPDVPLAGSLIRRRTRRKTVSAPIVVPPPKFCFPCLPFTLSWAQIVAAAERRAFAAMQ